MSPNSEEHLDLRARQRAERRQVIAMAVPVVITTSSRAVMDIVDFMMITRLGISEAQAAILPAQLIMWTCIVFGMGVLSMVNTFSSQSLGRKRFSECSAYGWQSLYLAAAAAVVAMVARPFLPEVIALFRHEAAVQVLELAYARVAILTVGPTLAAAGLGWFFIGVHKPWVTTWSVIEANVVNFVVSFVLIFGHLGFDRMGIAGAAWGTFVGVSYRAVRLTVSMMTPSMHRQYDSRRQWRPSPAKVFAMLRAGVPCALHWVTEVFVWAIFVNVLVGTKFGTPHLVATSAAWQYLRISFMPTVGIGQALTSLVGKAIGAKDPDRAIRDTRMVCKLTLTYMGGLGLIYACFGSQLIGWFNDDPEVMRIGGSIMICAAVFQLFDAVGIAYDGALRGAGDTLVPSTFFVVAAWVILIGGGSYMVKYHHDLGSLGPWLAASTFIVTSGVFLWWRWRGRAWLKIELLDRESPGEQQDAEPAVEPAL